MSGDGDITADKDSDRLSIKADCCQPKITESNYIKRGLSSPDRTEKEISRKGRRDAEKSTNECRSDKQKCKLGERVLGRH